MGASNESQFPFVTEQIMDYRLAVLFTLGLAYTASSMHSKFKYSLVYSYHQTQIPNQ